MKTWVSTPLFDHAESQQRAAEGVALAAENNPLLVLKAREIAVKICKHQGTANMDDVMFVLVAQGVNINALGNAAGSVFRDRRFEFAGTYTKSVRVHANGNLLRNWRLAADQPRTDTNGHE